MARPTILLTRDQIAAGVDVAAAIPAIRQAMGQFELGQDYLPPKAIYTMPLGPGMVGACITGYTQAANLLTMKIGHERTGNPARGLPTTNSWILVFEPQTAELLMICDGTLPTMIRTGAAAAVAADLMALPGASTLAVIGAGQLGRQCLRAASLVRPFRRILVSDVNPDAAAKLARDLAPTVKAVIEPADAQAACSQADVIVTATNSRAPIVMSQWIKPGAHLSCMGSDLPDKIECEMSLLPRCRIFADVVEHALARGEVSQAVQAGVLGKDCYAGTLGQVINGTVPGRQNDQQITMFDGVGIGIQDTAIIRTIYDQAVAQGLGTPLAFS
jgi:ornithine cyclodeaminase/alanine dehydrogenase-like protein (mu-crystallin family)